MKEQVINIPENFKIKKIKNNKIILVEKEKETYKQVAEKLFNNRKAYYIYSSGDIHYVSCFLDDPCNCVSKEQAKKLIAINKLLNVAKYVNGDWKPDWNNNEERKYCITIYNDYNNNNIKIQSNLWVTENVVYFKSEEAAKKAINILGEDTIKLAFSNY